MLEAQPQSPEEKVAAQVKPESAHWNSDGSLKNIQHTSTDGKVETLVKKGSYWEVQSGSETFRAKVTFDPYSGAYDYVSEDGQRAGHQNADGSRTESAVQKDGMSSPIELVI